MRIRTVKPELFRHEDLFDAEEQTGLPLRLAFIGMFGVCDREGRFLWKIRTLKSQVMPFDNVDFSRVLDALVTCGFIVKYNVDGVDYGSILTFKKHQQINNREKESVLPDPPKNIDKSSVVSRDSRVDDATSTRHEGKGKERNKERKGKEQGKTRDEALPHADLFSQAWEEWKQFRIEKKAKLTPSTIKAQLKKLGAMTEQQAVLTIQQSIENGWQGLFPDKITGAKPNREAKANKEFPEKLTAKVFE